MDMPLPQDAAAVHPSPQPYTLKELGPKHKQVIALLAQGVNRATVAEVVDYTPEYITWLARQPACQAYMREISAFVDLRLEALGDRVVDVLTDAMNNGSHDSALRAAKLQMEATGRIGKYKETAPASASEERLERLSNRLIDLLKSQREVVEINTFEGESESPSESR